MKDPAALVYIDKWIAATNGMKAQFRAWYFDLMLYQFDKGPIPNDLDEMAGICRVRPSEYDLFNQMVNQVVKQKFNQNDNGEWFNTFADEVISKRKSFKEKRTKSSNIGVVVRMARQIKGASEKVISALKKELYEMSIEEIEEHKNKKVLNQVVNRLVNLYINEDVNEDKDIYINSFSLLLSFLEKTVNSLSLSQTQDSRTFHNAVYKALVGKCECFYEYSIPNGRIDIMVKLSEEEKVAIELDNRTPRAKNIMKVEGLGFKIISILRDPYLDKSYDQFNLDGLILYSPQPRYISSVDEMDLSELKNQISNEATWKEGLCRDHKVIDPSFTPADLENWIEIFFTTIKNDGEERKTVKDFKKHFNRWLSLQIKKNLSNEQQSNNQNQGASLEYRRKQAERLGAL